LPVLLAAAMAACGGGDGGGGGGTPLNITTATVNDGMIGQAYNASVAATGGTGAKAFSISAGTLPAGLTISASGAISGQPTGPAGDASFTVSVTDSAATPATDSQALTITIVDTLTITTASIPNPVSGQPYSVTIQATGGTQPYTFSAEGLPSGIGLAADGTLSGVLTSDATSGTLTVDVADSSTPSFTASQSYPISVPLDIITTVLPDAAGGIAYSNGLLARGGLPPYQWSLTGGALPNGLTMDAAGVISGTPDAACTTASTTIDAQVTDSDTPQQVADQAGISLMVEPATLGVATASLPAAVIGVAYNQRIAAAGGVPPYSFALTGGALPSQLSLAANGRITGTPDTVEAQSFQVTVTDACPNTAARNLSLTVNNAALGRNDTIAQATNLPGNGSYAASISPSGDPNTSFAPDEDYYRIHTTATSTVTIDINAQVNGSPLDSVIEVVSAGGAVLNQCGSPTFDAECVSDDEVLGVQLDSLLQLRVTGATTFYIHVVDWGSNARPDKLYDLVISGVN
jgi:hypothetical protein